MRYKQQLENRRLAQQQKEAQQAREMEQQRNKIEDRKKQLQKHLEDNCLDLAVKIHGEEPGKIKLIPPTATDALTIFVEMNGYSSVRYGRAKRHQQLERIRQPDC